MKNKEYIGLLEGNEKSERQRIETIVKIVEEKLASLTASIRKEKLNHSIVLDAVSKKAQEFYEEHCGALKEKYMVKTSLVMEDDGGWMPRIILSKRAYYAQGPIGGFRGAVNFRDFAAQVEQSQLGAYAIPETPRGPTGFNNVELTGHLQMPNRNGTAVDPELTDRVIRAINDAAPMFADLNAERRRITAGTIRAGAITTEDVGTWSTPEEARDMRITSDSFTEEFMQQMRTAPTIAIRAEDSPRVEFIGAPYYEDVDREALREATWNERSLTEDMREANQQRIMEDIQNSLAAAVNTSGFVGRPRTHDIPTVLNRIHERMQGHQARGELREYNLEEVVENRNVMGPPSVNIRMSVVPATSVERIQMGISYDN